jgi:hypothetical protein
MPCIWKPPTRAKSRYYRRWNSFWEHHRISPPDITRLHRWEHLFLSVRFRCSVFRPCNCVDLFWHFVWNFVWDTIWPEQWPDWTSNIQRPTSNVEYWWRYALSILKQANPRTQIRRNSKSGFAPDLRSHLGWVGLRCLFFKLTEYIIRCWTFNVRRSFFS